MHRWAFIGTGDISRRLASDLLTIEPGAITAVWGRTEQTAQVFAHDHGIEFASDSLERVLALDTVDIVYIATPAATHCAFALQALAAGKHVLVEKPMTTSAADTARIFSAAREAGKFAMEAMWMRFNPLHIEIRERIADGLIGEVNSVRASFGTPFQARPPRAPRRVHQRLLRRAAPRARHLPPAGPGAGRPAGGGAQQRRQRRAAQGPGASGEPARGPGRGRRGDRVRRPRHRVQRGHPGRADRAGAPGDLRQGRRLHAGDAAGDADRRAPRRPGAGAGLPVRPLDDGHRHPDPRHAGGGGRRR